MSADFDSTTLVYGIGAPRTGTKWMSKYFTDHPQILMSPIRILHYFDAKYEWHPTLDFDQHYRDRLATMEARGVENDMVDAVRDRVRMIEEPDAYLEYFRKRWTGERAVADITPRYCDLPTEAFAEMLTKHPQVRFLFVMRNPIDRMWSGARLAWTRDRSYDLFERFDRQTSLNKRVNWADTNYMRTINRLEAAVPRDLIRYFFFETLFTESSVRGLCDFVGVDYVPAEIDVPQNRSDPHPLGEERRIRAAQYFKPLFEIMAERFGDAFPQSWADDLALAG